MWWRVPRGGALWRETAGAPAKRALRRLVSRGEARGILAFAGDDPVGWCAIGPRSDFPRVERVRALAGAGADGVWSINCFYIPRAWRGRGVASALLDAAIKACRRHGATIVEGYPVRPAADGKPTPGAFAWTGMLSMFEQRGFEPVRRRQGEQDPRPPAPRAETGRPASAGYRGEARPIAFRTSRPRDGELGPSVAADRRSAQGFGVRQPAVALAVGTRARFTAGRLQPGDGLADLLVLADELDDVPVLKGSSLYGNGSASDAAGGSGVRSARVRRDEAGRRVEPRPAAAAAGPWTVCSSRAGARSTTGSAATTGMGAEPAEPSTARSS